MVRNYLEINNSCFLVHAMICRNVNLPLRFQCCYLFNVRIESSDLCGCFLCSRRKMVENIVIGCTI